MNTLWLKRIFFGATLAAFISVLVVMPQMLMMNTVPRGLFLHAALFVAVISYGLLAVKEKAYKPDLKNPLTAGVVIFMAGMVVALPFAIDPLLTFLPTANRMVNVSTFLLLGFWVLGFKAIIGSREWRSTLLRASVMITNLAILISIMNGNIWRDGARLETILGNPLHFALYLVPMLFIALYAGLNETQKEWRRVLLVSAAAQGAFLIALGSRGPLLGVAVAGVLLTVYLVQTRGWWKYKSVNAAALLLLIAVTATGIAIRIPAVKSFGMEDLPYALSRVVFTGIDQRRLILWDTALDAMKEKPLFGYGAEQFEHKLTSVYRKDSAYGLLVEPRYDRVHNGFIDHAFQFGVIGLFGLLMLWITFFTTVLGRLKEHPLSKEVILLTGGVAYLVSYGFSFETPLSTFIAFFLLALVASGEAKRIEVEESRISLKTLIPALGVAGFVLVAFVYWPLKQSFLHQQFLVTAPINPRAASEILQKTFAYPSAFAPEYALWLVRGVTPHLERDPVKPEALALLKDTSKVIADFAESKPYHTRLQIRAAEALLWTAETEEELARIQGFVDRAQQASPNHFLPAFMEAELAYAKQDHQKAVDWYEKAAERALGLEEQMTSIVRRGASLVALGQTEQGLMHLALAEQRGYEIYLEHRFAKEFAPKMTPDIEIDWAVSYIDHVWRLYPHRLDVMRARTLIHYVAQEHTTGRTMVRTIFAVDEEYATETVTLLETLEQIELE